jgi:Domain of unknown function (DUF4124)
MTNRTKAGLALGVVLIVAPATLGAETYRWIDGQGNVVYSDRPPQPDEAGAPAAAAPPAESKALEPKAAGSLKERGANGKTGPTKVDDLLELSGARAQLAGLLGTIAGELRPAPGTMSANDHAAIERILARALRHETVYGLMRDAFLPHVDRANLETTAAWLRSPLGRKIVVHEIASSESGAKQKIADYGASLKTSPPDAHRMELVQRLDWTTAGTEISADLVAAVARGMTMAVSDAGPAEQRLRPGQIEDRAAQVRARASGNLRAAHTTSTLYAYRDLTDDELTAYVMFSASDAGRWYHTAMRKAMVSALGRTIEQAAADTVRAVPLERRARVATPPQQVK